jgi:hypothetical protein
MPWAWNRPSDPEDAPAKWNAKPRTVPDTFSASKGFLSLDEYLQLLDWTGER